MRSGCMKAARLHKYHEALKVESIDEPKITGPLDVIVKIGAAGLCRTDLHIQEGQWAEKSGVELPYVLGHENAGWVHEIGSAVSNVEGGDTGIVHPLVTCGLCRACPAGDDGPREDKPFSRVAVGDTVIVHPLVTCGLCRACRAGDDVHCENNLFPGISVDGGFAELLKTSARSVVKLDPSLHPKDIAALADAGLTAYHAVKKAAQILHPGSRAVVIGAGGLGHIGIQCLSAMTPAEIIVIDPNERARALAGDIGADHTVAADGTQVDTILEMTDGKGAEAIIDFVGERGAIEDGVAKLRQAGSYYVIGYG